MKIRFEFPLEIEGAALGGVTIEIDNKKIVAKVKEKEKAQNTYVIFFFFHNQNKLILLLIIFMKTFRMMLFLVVMELIWWNNPKTKFFPFKLVLYLPRNL